MTPATSAALSRTARRARSGFPLPSACPTTGAAAIAIAWPGILKKWITRNPTVNAAITIVPRELISRWLGGQAGVKGVLIACVTGGLVPGTPYAVFPLVAGFFQAGAGLGAVVGFTSAWALWSVTRLPIEMALIDPKAALVRYSITFVVPPIAGLIANAVTRFL